MVSGQQLLPCVSPRKYPPSHVWISHVAQAKMLINLRRPTNITTPTGDHELSPRGTQCRPAEVRLLGLS